MKSRLFALVVAMNLCATTLRSGSISNPLELIVIDDRNAEIEELRRLNDNPAIAAALARDEIRIRTRIQTEEHEVQSMVSWSSESESSELSIRVNAAVSLERA